MNPGRQIVAPAQNAIGAALFFQQVKKRADYRFACICSHGFYQCSVSSHVESLNRPFQLCQTGKPRLNISKAGRLLGWQPRIQLNEGLARSPDFFRGNLDASVDCQLQEIEHGLADRLNRPS